MTAPDRDTPFPTMVIGSLPRPLMGAGCHRRPYRRAPERTRGGRAARRRGPVGGPDAGAGRPRLPLGRRVPPRELHPCFRRQGGRLPAGESLARPPDAACLRRRGASSGAAPSSAARRSSCAAIPTAGSSFPCLPPAPSATSCGIRGTRQTPTPSGRISSAPAHRFSARRSSRYPGQASTPFSSTSRCCPASPTLRPTAWNRIPLRCRPRWSSRWRRSARSRRDWTASSSASTCAMPTGNGTG